MTGEVIGDMTGDIISDAIVLTVRRALLSRARRRASAAVAAVAAAILFQIDNFQTDRGGRTGTNRERRAFTTEYIRVYGGRAAAVRNRPTWAAAACARRPSPEPDHVEIGAWSRDRGRGEPVISVLQQLQQLVRRAVSARAARWLAHVSCRPGARGVSHYVALGCSKTPPPPFSWLGLARPS
eukprot:scaffold38574_cov49-Phaeocystis_antarctica.AAC.3